MMNRYQLLIFLTLFLTPITIAVLIGILVSPWGWMALLGEMYTCIYPLFVASSIVSENEGKQ